MIQLNLRIDCNDCWDLWHSGRLLQKVAPSDEEIALFEKNVRIKAA